MTDRDEVIALLGTILAGLAAPVSIQREAGTALPLGRAVPDAWVQLHRELVGSGWADAGKYAAGLRRVLGVSTRVSMDAGPMHDSGPVDQEQVAVTQAYVAAVLAHYDRQKNGHAQNHDVGEFEDCTRNQCVAARKLHVNATEGKGPWDE